MHRVLPMKRRPVKLGTAQRTAHQFTRRKQPSLCVFTPDRNSSHRSIDFISKLFGDKGALQLFVVLVSVIANALRLRTSKL